MNRRCNRLFALAGISIGLLAVSPAFAAWGSFNYGSGSVDLYTPKTLPASPGLVVIIHYCGGNAGSTHGWLDSMADQYGFYQVSPQAGGNCFDAAPGRSGERAKIVSMVDAMMAQKSVDKTKVFAAGASSGACMTQALLASYPDVFAAGSSLAGVPVGAWTGGNAYGWSAPSSTTAQQWGDKVRQADPGFSGKRPRVQLWHGQGDTTLTYSQSYPAQLAQWTNVFGLTDADATKTSIKPTGAQDTWARSSYQDDSGTVVLEANNGPSNVPHDLSGRGLWTDVARFFYAQATPPDAGAGGAGGGPGSGGATGTGGTTGGAGGTGDAGGDSGVDVLRDAGEAGSDLAGTGGTLSGGSGGTAQTGGATGSGSATGGGAGNGGRTGSGGSIGSGGTSATGGRAGSGGSSASGGSSGSGGSNAGGSNTGGATVVSSESGNGCACAVGNRSNAGGLAFLAAGLLGLARVRRRRRPCEPRGRRKGAMNRAPTPEGGRAPVGS